MLVENKPNCTGCGACFNVCPKCAITIQGDEYGFYKPIIDQDKCVNCNLCEKICPLESYKSLNFEHPKVIAFQNSDEEVLYKCASGGAFAKLAKHTIEQGGVVYGVMYDENMIVSHSRATNLTDLEKMYSSKYVQSDTRDTFKQAKKDLDNGKLVLFSGTPCQIAGLKKSLQKYYENLITVDLVCHGVPSPLVFERYKQEFISKLPNEKILNINFRSKIKGWNPYYLSIRTKNKDYNIQSNKSVYTKLFLNNLNMNNSCLNCKFNGFPRAADLTVGDFWGIDKYDKTINNNKGLSVILLNSEKGAEYFSEIKTQAFSREVPLDIVVKYNPNIVKSSIPNIKREEFFEDIKNGKSLKDCVKKYCKEPLHIVIYRMLPQFVKDFIKYKVLKIEKC